MAISVTITAPNVTDSFGRALVVGATYSLGDDLAKSLIGQGKATAASAYPGNPPLALNPAKQYAGTPISNVTPDTVGQYCQDTTTGVWYVATTAASTGWRPASAGVAKSYAGSPVGNLTPDFVGQRCQDTTGKKTYMAMGTDSYSWARMSDRIIGLSTATTISEVIFEQSPGGQYLLTQNDSTYGKNGAQLSIGTGSLGSLTKTAISATYSGLKDNAGAETLGTSHNIVGAWWVSETRFLFCGRGFSGNPANKFYLWLCDYNGGAWKVGQNSPTFDDGRAVLDLGLYSGGQATDSGVLHQRSVAVGNGKILIGEYNVASGRVSGSTKDAVRVYQSTDSGATWSALLTFNTSGNQIRHCHGVKYDRYTGDYYMMFGDLPNSALVRWNGTGAAPPANTPLTVAGFGAYPGWEIMHDAAGVECRSGDVAIHPHSVHYMADNGDGDTAEKYAFLVSKSRPMMRLRSEIYDRTAGRDPLICVELPNGGAIWSTLSGPLDTGAAPESWKGYDFWYTPDGISFIKVAKTRHTGAATTGVFYNMFMSNEGSIVISGSAAKGAVLLPSAADGSLVVTPGAWGGSVTTLQGSA